MHGRELIKRLFNFEGLLSGKLNELIMNIKSEKEIAKNSTTNYNKSFLMV